MQESVSEFSLNCSTLRRVTARREQRGAVVDKHAAVNRCRVRVVGQRRRLFDNGDEIVQIAVIGPKPSD